MKKANSTNKVLIGFTLLFMMIAGFSFAAFRETEGVCSQVKNCSPIAPSDSKGGEMLWDSFSRFVSFVAIK